MYTQEGPRHCIFRFLQPPTQLWLHPNVAALAFLHNINKNNGQDLQRLKQLVAQFLHIDDTSTQHLKSILDNVVYLPCMCPSGAGPAEAASASSSSSSSSSPSSSSFSSSAGADSTNCNGHGPVANRKKPIQIVAFQGSSELLR